jgi:hypothetical protein
MHFANPTNLQGLAVVFVMPLSVNLTAELAALAFEDACSQGGFVLAPAGMALGVIGRGAFLVVVVVGRTPAGPSGIVAAAIRMAAVLVQSKPSCDIAGAGHEGLAASAVAHSWDFFAQLSPLK